MFKEGQTVYCTVYGKGVIYEIRKDTHPIYVEFESGRCQIYDKEGKLEAVAHRSLFFSEPKIDALTSPLFEPTLAGKYILYKQVNYGGSYSYHLGSVWEDRADSMLVVGVSGPRTVLKPLSYTVLDESQLPK